MTAGGGATQTSLQSGCAFVISTLSIGLSETRPRLRNSFSTKSGNPLFAMTTMVSKT